MSARLESVHRLPPTDVDAKAKGKAGSGDPAHKSGARAPVGRVPSPGIPGNDRPAAAAMDSAFETRRARHALGSPWGKFDRQFLAP